LRRVDRDHYASISTSFCDTKAEKTFNGVRRERRNNTDRKRERERDRESDAREKREMHENALTKLSEKFPRELA